MRTALRAGVRQVAGRAVGRAALRGGAVGQEVIEARSVGKQKLARGAVTKITIAAGAVAEIAIEPGAVVTTKLADGAVTTPKVAADAITQIVSAVDNFVLIAAAETDCISVAINRNADSDLDINCFMVFSGIDGGMGAGPPFATFIMVYRDSTLLETYTTPVPMTLYNATPGDQRYAGVVAFGFVDTDNVSGAHTYKFSILLTDNTGVTAVGGGLVNGQDAYIRLLERQR